MPHATWVIGCRNGYGRGSVDVRGEFLAVAAAANERSILEQEEGLIGSARNLSY